MKKLLSLIALVAVFAISCTALTSCGDDDNTSSSDMAYYYMKGEFRCAGASSAALSNLNDSVNTWFYNRKNYTTQFAATAAFNVATSSGSEQYTLIKNMLVELSKECQSSSSVTLSLMKEGDKLPIITKTIQNFDY